MKLLLPNVNHSLANDWTADDEGNLRLPLCEIKGVGPVAANSLVKERIKNGAFKDKDDISSRIEAKKVNARVQQILEEVGAFDEKAGTSGISDEELDSIGAYFDFDLSNDPMYKFKYMINNRIKTQIHISKLSDISDERDSTDRFYFGFMSTVRYGYKEKIKDSGDSTGLGGVYGYYEDGTDSSMLTFGTEIYNERKYEIEHCAGRWLLSKSNSPYLNQNLYTNNIWFGEDLLAGNAFGLDLNLADKIRYEIPSSDILDCKDCNLSEECTKPVLPSIGEYNMMIVGEAPGFNEDASGVGFVGDAGDILWNGRRITIGLEEFDLDRSMFHITNVCKCYPKFTKTPKGPHVKKCSKWMKAEIEAVKPFIIYALGNTCMRFFKNKESGIMSQVEENPTEWSNEYNCWICWNIHPAMVLYNPENKIIWENGINNFVEKVGILGFGAGV